VGRQPGKPGWLATVVNLTGGTARRLVPAERRGRRPGKSVTLYSGPRYCGASPCKNLYTRTLVLNSLRHVQPVKADTHVGDVVHVGLLLWEVSCKTLHVCVSGVQKPALRLTKVSQLLQSTRFGS